MHPRPGDRGTWRTVVSGTARLRGTRGGLFRVAEVLFQPARECCCLLPDSQAHNQVKPLSQVEPGTRGAFNRSGVLRESGGSTDTGRLIGTNPACLKESQQRNQHRGLFARHQDVVEE